MKTIQKRVKFSKGEINPKLLERQDLQILDASASYIKNMTSTPFGSIRVREGTQRIDQVAINLAEVPKPTITAYAGVYESKYGTGADGEIIVTSGVVDIADIYNNDNVPGVTTYRGTGKGLNHSDLNPTGPNAYNPIANQVTNLAYNVPQATNFTVMLGATLSCSAWDGIDNRKGIIWVAFTGTFNNLGTIDLVGMGAAGGAGGGVSGWGSNGTNTGYGHRGGNLWWGIDGAGGISYGTSPIPLTTWADLYGSGGGGGGGSFKNGFETIGGQGGGGAGHAVAGTAGGTGGNWIGNFSAGGSAGANGGGALRLYGANVDMSGGIIVDTSGANSSNPAKAGGKGGGGSGGTIYIEVTGTAALGTDKMVASAGIGGPTGYHPSEGRGGDGAQGRIHINGSYTGSTSDPPIA